jgi:large subunit ribosomal protein L21
MKYAVVKISGHQYRIAEGDEVLVDKLSDKPQVDVLMVVNEDKVTVGKPLVKKAIVKVKVVEEEVKGEKLYVSKYKAKSRERRRIGFRPKYTKLLVQSITL